MDIKTDILYDDRRSEYFPLIVDEMHRQKISKYIFVDPIPHDNVV